MTKYIKDKSGKFAGSIPDAPKLDVVEAPKVPAAPTAPQADGPAPLFNSPEWKVWVENKRLAQLAKYEQRAAAVEVIKNFTDKIHSEYPKARLFVFNQSWDPLRIEGYDNEVVLDLESEEHAALADTLKIETMNSVEGFEQLRDRDYRGPEGTIGVSMLIKCDVEEDCDFRRPAFGWAPGHTASPRCSSGGRAHCTCDTCF